LSELKFIIGLGNPGVDYEYTRHNLGFLAVRHLAARFAQNFTKSSFTNGFMAEAKIEGQDVCLFLPLTYMNHSGVAVKKIVDTKQLTLDNILIICDDFNLNFGQIRIKPKGSDGGHNGLSSVIEHLQTEEFSRLRMGISSPRSDGDIVDYVLEEFDNNQKKSLEPFLKEAADCSLGWLKEGINNTMELYNRRKENGKE